MAGRRRVNEIWLSGDIEESRERWPTTPHTRVRRVPADQLERRARTNAPQGVVAFAAPIVPADVDEMLADPAAFLVALDGVTDPQNLGAVMRTAETAGATGIVLPRHRAVGLTPAVAKAAAGALEYLPVAFVSGIPGVLEHATRAHVWCVGLDADGDTPIFHVAGCRPTARARPRCRGPRPVAARSLALRSRRVDPHAREHRVAQRECGRRDRVHRDTHVAPRNSKACTRPTTRQRRLQEPLHRHPVRRTALPGVSRTHARQSRRRDR